MQGMRNFVRVVRYMLSAIVQNVHGAYAARRTQVGVGRDAYKQAKADVLARRQAKARRG